MMLTELREALEKYSYKPGSEFYLREPELQTSRYEITLRMTVPNATLYPEFTSMTNFHSVEYLSSFELANLTHERLKQLIVGLVRRAELHEMDEFLRFDGTYVNDPHPELAEQARMMEQANLYFRQFQETSRKHLEAAMQPTAKMSMADWGTIAKTESAAGMKAMTNFYGMDLARKSYGKDEMILALANGSLVRMIAEGSSPIEMELIGSGEIYDDLINRLKPLPELAKATPAFDTDRPKGFSNKPYERVRPKNRHR